MASLSITAASGAPQASLAPLRRRYESCRGRLHEPSLVLRLYYAAPKPLLERILAEGFEAVPLEPSALHAFGRGWYFTRYFTPPAPTTSNPHRHPHISPSP